MISLNEKIYFLLQEPLAWRVEFDELSIFKDEFLSFIKDNYKDFKVSQGIKSSFFDMDTPELLAPIDTSLSELIYEENEDVYYKEKR